MSTFLATPDRTDFVPFQPTDEQARFLLGLFELDPVTGRRRYRRAVISRPKGWGKSPLLSAWIIAESLAPVVPDGWDAHGQPVARPWAELRTPWAQVCATSAEQTANAWVPLLEMIRGGSVVDEYDLDPMDTFIAMPKGRIEPVTAAATSREGNRPIACLLDQTESWLPANGGVRLAATLRRNLGKTGGVSVEAPNAYFPGLESVAEDSARYWSAIQEGRTQGDDGLLYDHREAPGDTELDDDESLLNGLRIAYGDSASDAGGWVDLRRIMAEVRDPGTDPQDARAFYLGQITHAKGSWVTSPQWNAVADATKYLSYGDTVTLGFDGSVRDDSTALVACRVDDGHLELLACWEKPLVRDDEWSVPGLEVDAAVAAAMQRFRVIGFYADPPYWETYVDRWNSLYGRKMRVGHRSHPLEWKTNQPSQMEEALKRFLTAVLGGQLSHDGGSQLTRHILNARRRLSATGKLAIGKDPQFPSKKIDAAMAAVLAFECRADALATGKGRIRKSNGFRAQRAI
ncbi:hypothetical protein [Kineosporia succinea]|uniref:Phage terminase large subunit-like protein n=1 Tax=Kineosporia succinea TaxID=84632 RepID=A0ABT9NXR4_9ACTN|nr:hypothetical protein [Kineosporia succinea]MDP9825213.1 hypothetical protein [Kineosporia succinea]